MSDDVLAEALRPVGLGERGQALWDALTTTKIDPARAVLVAEAARLADMLELFDGIIRGDSEAWAEIEVPETGQTSKIVINSVVSERRQTVTVFRHTIAQLTTVGGVAPPAVSPDEEAPASAPAKTVDDIARKRDERRRAASDL